MSILFIWILALNLGFNLSKEIENVSQFNFQLHNEKYITYNWELESRCHYCNLTIIKNNVTYLHMQSNYDHILFIYPWYAFTYTTCDKYQWITNCQSGCTAFNNTKFYIEPMNVYHVTETMITDSFSVPYKTSKYIIIDIPHFKEQLENSCLNIEISISNYNDGSIRIFDNDIKDSITVNPIFAYKDNVFKCNLVIGCIYPTQKTLFDLQLGKKYIMEVKSYYRSDYNIKLVIVPRETAISDFYKIITIILSCLIFMSFIIFSIIYYIKIYTPQYEKVDQEIE